MFIVSFMTSSEYNFHYCKLCGQASARPTYHLGDMTIFVCGHCDFHFNDHLDCSTTHQNRSTELTEQARNYIDLRREESADFHAARLDLIQQVLHLNQSLCLDIGAGLGQFQLLLAQQGAKTKGIEPSPLRRAYAREQFDLELKADLVDNACWQQHHLATFDLITLWDVLEHVDFPRETLEAAVRLLNPGGLLALDTPSREVPAYRLGERLYRLSRGRLSLFLPSFYSTARFGHKQIFTRQQVLQLFSKLGLEIVTQPDSYALSGHSGRKIIVIGRKKVERPAL